MDTRQTDFLVGLFILVSVGITVGALIVTSGLGEVRYDLYMRAETAQDLTQDTRIFLQGLEIGRVRQINPVVDSATGALRFVARLTIKQRYPDGAQVRLPILTRAVIAQTSPIAPPVIQMTMPAERRVGLYLQAGDTLDSERRSTALDKMGDVATQLSTEVGATLQETRRLILHTDSAVTRTNTLLATTTPQVQQVLSDLAGTLARTDRMLATLEPRIVPFHDSLAAAVTETRGVVRRLDELTRTAHTMATENQGAVRETIQRLLHSASLMERFADQVSRRPMRLLTGVRPAPDTTSLP